PLPCHWLPGGQAECLAFAGGGHQGAAEAVGLSGGAEAFLPQPATHLPAHLVRGYLGAFVDLGPVDPHVEGRSSVTHQAASSCAASQRWYSDRRMRRLPFGSVMHLGALPFARH